MHQNWYGVWTPRLAVRFYRPACGAEPVREWLMSLAKKARRVVGEDIKTVQLGWPLGAIGASARAGPPPEAR